MSNYKFCPQCKAGLKTKYEEGHKRLVCPQCDFIYYNNSKPTASAVIVNGNKILLCRRAISPYKDFWDLPGGFLEGGEDPEEGVKREIKEELQVEIDIIDILGIFMDRYGRDGDYTLNIYYLAKIKSGKPCPDSDINEIKWFRKDNLPSKMAFKNNEQALEVWKKR
jgi:ADP-ribose pyrophosphatase YjhB (NUDIX family)